MSKLKAILASAALLVAYSAPSHAALMFSFTESGGNVLMQSSGVLDTSKLIAADAPVWGGTGLEANRRPNTDIMGDSSPGQIDLGFGFSLNTDMTAWNGNMFTIFGPFFGVWSSTGTTQFATYVRSFGRTRAGIGIGAEDLNGALWSPDVSWKAAGTFAQLGLTPGIYTVEDRVTAEAITIRIGAAPTPVSAPAPLMLLLLSFATLSYKTRRRD